MDRSHQGSRREVAGQRTRMRDTGEWTSVSYTHFDFEASYFVLGHVHLGPFKLLLTVESAWQQVQPPVGAVQQAPVGSWDKGQEGTLR